MTSKVRSNELIVKEVRQLEAPPTWLEFAVNPGSVKVHLQQVNEGLVKGPSGRELVIQFMKKAEGFESAVDIFKTTTTSKSQPTISHYVRYK